MELTPSQRDALTQALHGVRADVRARVVEYATVSWQTLGNWRDDDIARFVSAVVPQIEAGKRTVAQATDAALSAMIDDDPAGLADLGQIRGGVTAAEVYRRPAVTMRTALAEGASVSEAIERGAQRLESLVKTDLQLAHTHQARASLTAPPRRRGVRRRPRGAVEAFRRVPSGTENCALCLIASTQRYWVGDLLPIHPGCDCQVQSLGHGEHVAQIIDAELLEAVHDQVEGIAGLSDRGGREVDYRQLIVTREHGEYGPTIGWRHQKHTGPEVVEAARERVAIEPAREPEPIPEPETSSWFFENIRGEELGDYLHEDLMDLYNTAADANDPQAMAFVSKELEKRERQAAGYRGTGYTRAELREQYDEHVDREYWAAEAAANGFLLNEAGRREGIDPKSLFTGTEARALKYASDELKWYWSDHPRLSFDAFVGDSDAIGRAGRVDF